MVFSSKTYFNNILQCYSVSNGVFDIYEINILIMVLLTTQLRIIELDNMYIFNILYDLC